MTETQTARQDMLDKVRKLLRKAESVAGTPEAETLTAKAFELIAKYGIDETAARQRDGEGPAPIKTMSYVISGTYQREQTYLFHRLAEALHCVPLWDISEPGTRRQTVWGTESHLERLSVLFATLTAQMLAGAARVRPHRGASVNVRNYRASWMFGFYTEVAARLRDAENVAADRSGEAGTALVLLDDEKRARAAMESAHGADALTEVKGRQTYSKTAAELGAKAGSRVDLGQTRVGSRRAIGR